MAVIHISEADAVRDFSGLLAQVRAGAEILIRTEGRSGIAVHLAADPPIRRLSESLVRARKHRPTTTLDGEFAADLETAVNSHPEPLQSPWD